ncbi:MAG: hypothetical protein ACLP5E_07710 [Streptosporangiaceae bacterium]
MAVDIESHSSRSAPDQIDLQNRLLWALVQACHAAGVSPARCDRQPSGDGMILILPGVDERRVLTSMVLGLLSGLLRVNEDPGRGGRMRLRVSLGQGSIQVGTAGYASQAVIVVAQLLDCTELRQALKDNQAADAAVIVTPDLYEDLFSQGYGGLPAGGFREVHVSIPAKNFSHTGWIQVPGNLPRVLEVPPYQENPGLSERQRNLVTGTGLVAAAGGLAWAALAGVGAPRTRAGGVEATLTGMASHSDFLPEALLPPGLRPGSGPDSGGQDARQDGHGHDLGHDDVPHDGSGHETADGTSPGDSSADGHRGYGEGAGHSSYGRTAATYSASQDSDPLPPNSQAALDYSTGQENAGLAERVVAYTEIYGYTGYGTPYVTDSAAVEYTSGDTRAEEISQATEYKTADGVELEDWTETLAGSPGHESERLETFTLDEVGSESAGYQTTGFQESTYEEDNYYHDHYQVDSYEHETYDPGYDDEHHTDPGVGWV